MVQHEYGSLEEAQAFEDAVFGRDDARAIMAGYHESILEGTREIYKIAD